MQLPQPLPQPPVPPSHCQWLTFYKHYTVSPFCVPCSSITPVLSVPFYLPPPSSRLDLDAFSYLPSLLTIHEPFGHSWADICFTPLLP